MKNRYALLVFDWDGTLINSCNHIAESMQFAAHDLDWPQHEHEKIRELIGCGMFELIKTLYPNASEKERHQLIERYRHHFFAGKHRTLLYAGVYEALQHLHEQGYLLAIATAENRLVFDKVLEEVKLKPFFAATRCGDEAPAKPNPQIIMEIMEELQVLPQQTLMVGDTEYDMQTALNAGVDAVAVECGVHDSERLLRCNPVTHLTSVKELPAWLISLEWK